MTGKSIAANDIRKEKPQVLIVATGARPFMPRYVPGIDRDRVTNYDDIIRGRVRAGTDAIVVGGQYLVLNTAEFIIEQGARVTVIEATEGLAGDLEYMAQKILLARMESSNEIVIRLNSNIERINEDSVVVQSGSELETLDDIDQFVFAMEREMDRELIVAVTAGLVEELGIEYHEIGDCVWPREPCDAVLDGNTVARSI